MSDVEFPEKVAGTRGEVYGSLFGTDSRAGINYCMGLPVTLKVNGRSM